MRKQGFFNVWNIFCCVCKTPRADLRAAGSTALRRAQQQQQQARARAAPHSGNAQPRGHTHLSAPRSPSRQPARDHTGISTKVTPSRYMTRKRRHFRLRLTEGLAGAVGVRARFHCKRARAGLHGELPRNNGIN